MMLMNAKHYKNRENSCKYLSKFEDDEFIIDKKIRKNYRKYKQKIDTTTDSDTCEEENKIQKNVMQNESVKKVIEKFNRLSCFNNTKSLVRNDLALKPPEQIEIKTNEIKTDSSEKKSEHKRESKRNRANKKEKIKSSTKNSEKSIKKYAGSRKLRCPEKVNTNYLKNNNDGFFNIFKVPDEYIRFIDETRRKNIIKYTPKNTLDNLQLSKNELKHFTSTKTQTSPCSSNTNILINVYNAPSPKIYNTLDASNNYLQLKVSQDEQFKLSIAEKMQNFQNNDSKRLEKKRSVKNCVQEFEGIFIYFKAIFNQTI